MDKLRIKITFAWLTAFLLLLILAWSAEHFLMKPPPASVPHWDQTQGWKPTGGIEGVPSNYRRNPLAKPLRELNGPRWVARCPTDFPCKK